ncbi:MAG: TetR/AcrR family transcriptional regulator [Oscillospiraceae bacterium]|nr:TetR/AcrR family transcriptional regulator [Oscillospiraceae bacterium]
MPEEKTELEKRKIQRLSGEESNRISRECLRTALIHLLSEKELQKISVTELVSRAGVSRATFYRNYATKEELLAEVADSVTQEISSIIQAAIQGRGYEQYLAFFQKVRGNKKLAHNFMIAKVPFGSVLSLPSLIERDGAPKSAERHYLNLAFEGAFVNIIRGWIQSDMKESPEEMAALCVKILAGANLGGLQ